MRSRPDDKRRRLTDEQVVQARVAHRRGAGKVELARRYGINPRSMTNILSGTTYAELPGPTCTPGRTTEKVVPMRECDLCGADAPCERFRGQWTCPACLNPEPDAEYLAEERAAWTTVRSSWPDADREQVDGYPHGWSTLHGMLDKAMKKHGVPRLPGHQLRGVCARNRGKHE